MVPVKRPPPLTKYTMAKKIKKTPKLPPLGFSPVQATSSGAGVHEKTGKHRRRNDRRNVKRNLKLDGDL